jgi:hypothetical protein
MKKGYIKKGNVNKHMELIINMEASEGIVVRVKFDDYQFYIFK